MAEAKKLNSWCFVCGAENPQGLHIKKLRTEHGCRCDFTVERGWCGYAGILHGGIHAAILDEIMGDAVNDRLKTAVTLDMTIRYISPGREGMALVCEGARDDPRSRDGKAHLGGDGALSKGGCGEPEGKGRRTGRGWHISRA